MKIKTNVLAGKSLITNCHGLNQPPECYGGINP